VTGRFLVMASAALAYIVASSVYAWAENRVALVIGNSAYTNISPLINPKNDAALMAQTLKEVGFEVVLATDADRIALGRAIRKFGKTLRASGKDAIGLLFYAGHGVQARGANYLVPVGAQIEDHADLSLEAVSVSDILAQMESAGNRLNLVILDACRNNPFKGKFRNSNRGLARVEAASGSMVAFAAAPGQVALDGSGTNSPYTSALAAAIKQPGLTVEQVFKRVRVEVESRTGGTQTPWEESSLRGDFYFVNPPRSQNLAQGDDTVELTYWNSVKDSNDPILLKKYIEHYPQGLFAGLAEAMIMRLQASGATDARQLEQKTQATNRAADVAYWEAVSGSSDPELVRSYLERFPDGIFHEVALALLRQLEASHPSRRDDPFKNQQMAMMDTDTAVAQWQAVSQSSDPQQFMTFLQRFPDSIFSKLAQARLNQLKARQAETSVAATVNQQMAMVDTESAVAPSRAKSTQPARPTHTAEISPLQSDVDSAPDPDLPRKLQLALNKVGCDPGTIDGQWGRNSNSALHRFAKYAKLTLPDEPVNSETLDLVERWNGRVCPLECGKRQVENNGQCITKTCPKGRKLSASGKCRPKSGER